MVDFYSSTDLGVLLQIGEKVKSKRIAREFTQKQLAITAGVSLSAVQALEHGKNVSLLILVQILRAVQCLDLLEPFSRPEEISPIAYAEALKKSAPKQRVRKKMPEKPKYESEW